MRLRILAILSLCALLWLNGTAWSESKLAFVLGINTYIHLSPQAQLQRAVADADAVSDTLQDLGFTVTRVTQEASLDNVMSAFQRFTRSIQPGDTVVFYYAGHGISLDDGNYLIPADVPELGPTDEWIAKRRTIAEREIKQGLRAAGARVLIVILDACRTNPFSVRGTRSIGMTTRGLARVDVTEGVFSLYSAREGQAAIDRLSANDADVNSLFTRVFLKELKTPNLSLSELGEIVRDDVAALARDAGAEQVPAVSNELIGARKVFLAGRNPTVEPEKMPPPAVVGQQNDLSNPREQWNQLKKKAIDETENFDRQIDDYHQALSFARKYVDTQQGQGWAEWSVADNLEALGYLSKDPVERRMLYEQTVSIYRYLAEKEPNNVYAEAKLGELINYTSQFVANDVALSAALRQEGLRHLTSLQKDGKLPDWARKPLEQLKISASPKTK